MKNKLDYLTEEEIRLAIEALLFTASVDVICNFDDDDCVKMVEVAGKIHKQSKSELSDKVSVFGDSDLYDQEEITNKILNTFPNISRDL